MLIEDEDCGDDDHGSNEERHGGEAVLRRLAHDKPLVSFYVLALAIVITYVFNRTGGSVWAGILIHGGTNVWSKALGGLDPAILGVDLRAALTLAAALLILVVTGRQLGRRE